MKTRHMAVLAGIVAAATLVVDVEAFLEAVRSRESVIAAIMRVSTAVLLLYFAGREAKARQ